MRDENTYREPNDSIEVIEINDYIENIKPAAVEAIETTLKNGRFYFGSAGAGLTHQAYHPKYNHTKINRSSAKVGIGAERKTSNMLREWCKTHPNAVLIDSVHVDGFGDTEVNEETGVIEGGDTDHVLIIGNEVIIIDTKRWKSKRSYSVSDKGTVLRSTGKNKPKRGFPGSRINIRGALGIWRKYMGTQARVSGVICINADKVYVSRDKNWYKSAFRVVEAPKLIDFLDKKYAKMTPENKRIINTELVAKTVISCIKPYDEFKSFNLS